MNFQNLRIFVSTCSLLVLALSLFAGLFVIFGAIGCSIYLGYLANEVFEDSWMFPIALTAIGLGGHLRRCDMAEK